MTTGRPWLGLAGLACWACLACDPEPVTQVMLYVDADGALRERAGRLQIEVYDTEGRAQGPWAFRLDDPSASDFKTLPVRVPLVPRNGDAGRRYQAVADLFDRDDEPLGRQRAIGGYVAGRLTEVWLRFESDCETQICDSPQTCVSGECVDACVEPAAPGELVRSEPSACDPSQYSVFLPVGLPPGGHVEQVVLAPSNPSVLYARTSWGPTRVFRSEDSAESWNDCGHVFDFGPLSVSPDDDREIWVGARGDVSKSVDGCATFEESGLGEAATALLALRDGRVLGGTASGLRWFEQGAWSERPSPLDSHRVTVLAASGDESDMYAGSDSGGVARSDDGGQTWTSASTGLGSVSIADLKIDPSDPSRVFAQTSNGLYRSEDAGQNWSQVLRQGRLAVAISPADPNYVVAYGYDRLRASFDGGDTFDDVERRSPIMSGALIHELYFDSSASERLYAATRRGVFAVEGRDFEWVDANTGIDAWIVSDSFLEPSSGTSLLATTSGVLQSEDQGQTWLSRFAGILNNSRLFRVYADSPDRIYAIGEDLSRSTDGGESFNRLFQAEDEDGRDVAGVATAGQSIYVATERRLIESDDDWESFEAKTVAGQAGPIRDILLADAGSSSSLWVATANGIFVRPEGESEFAEFNEGLSSVDVYRVVEQSRGMLLVGTGDGTFRSDGAGAWSRWGLAGHSVEDLAVSDGNVAAVTDRGVFLRQGEAEWRPLLGLETRSPRAVGFDPEGRILVGTTGFGLFRTLAP